MDYTQCAASARDLSNAITRHKPRATWDLSMTLRPRLQWEKKPGRARARFYCKRSKCQKVYQNRPRHLVHLSARARPALGPAFSHCKRKPGQMGYQIWYPIWYLYQKVAMYECTFPLYASFGQQTMEAIMTSTMSHCWVRTFCAWVRKRCAKYHHILRT